MENQVDEFGDAISTEKPKELPIRPPYQDTVDMVEEMNKDKITKTRIHVSRTKFGYCKNEGCDKARRPASAYCGECR